MNKLINIQLLSIVTLLHNNTAKAQPKITPAMPNAKFTSKMALGNNISTHYVIGWENSPSRPIQGFLTEASKYLLYRHLFFIAHLSGSNLPGFK